jgi:hypothetical protein
VRFKLRQALKSSQEKLNRVDEFGAGRRKDFMSDTTSKKQIEFFVAKGQEQDSEHLGPWTIEDIAERIARSELSITDFVYDDVQADWIPLMECEALKEHLNRAKPKKAPPTKAAPQAPAKPNLKVAPPHVPAKGPAQSQAIAQPQIPKQQLTEWFVQKGANRYGPFSYFGLVRALQEKSVYDFDFIWKEGMDTWVRIAEHPEFQADRIRDLATDLSKSEEKSKDVFFRRQHARVRFQSEVIVHDDRSVWMGQAIEASVGGSGLVIENSTLTPGQVVRVHFAPCDGLPAFNALGEIVGKKFSKAVRGANSPVTYAVRFLQLDGAVEPQVREYFESKCAS